MVAEKGLPEDIADKIGKYVLLNGKTELLQNLLKDEHLSSNKRAKEGLDELAILFEYLESFSVMNRVIQYLIIWLFNYLIIYFIFYFY